MSRVAIAAGALAALAVAACATPPPPAAPLPPIPPRTPPSRSAPPAVMSPRQLPGWAAEDHLVAFEAYRTGCGADRSASGRALCDRARRLPAPGADAARRFLEDSFAVQLVGENGLLTAYFAPEYEARSRPVGAFTAPVRPRPADLTAGAPYADRTQIEARPAPDALAWMRPEDLFFLQIQGSGSLAFEDGRRMKVLFAAHNSLPFVGIATAMRDRGLLPANNTSADAIRNWLADHAGPEAEEVMRLNPRYVFFSLAPDDGRDPAGAAGIPLPAGHAIAVDPSVHSMGTVFWLDATAPALAGAFPVYRRLAVALDTGGAIRGAVRADLYLGRGAAAGTEAGRVRHVLRLYRLVPREPAP